MQRFQAFSSDQIYKLSRDISCLIASTSCSQSFALGHHGDWCLQRYSQQISSPVLTLSLQFNLPRALINGHYTQIKNCSCGTLSSNFQNISPHLQRDCYTSIWIRILFFFLITVLVKGKFTGYDNFKIQFWWFVFSRTEDLLKAQDLNKRMTDCGTITNLWQHCIDKQKLTYLIIQTSKAFLLLRKKELCTGSSVGWALDCHAGGREFNSGWTNTHSLKITE